MSAFTSSLRLRGLAAVLAAGFISSAQALPLSAAKAADRGASTGPVVQVHGRHHHHHRHHGSRYSRSVDAPYTYVETGRRRVVVDAPFTSVYVGRRGRYVRAPFVELWIPR